MALKSGALAKIGVAVGLGGAASAGVYYGQDYFSPKKILLSKYDQALINFLEAPNKTQDIVFEIKKGENWTDNFAATDLTFGSTNPATIKAKIQIVIPETASGTTFKGSNASTSLTTLRNNTSNTWTWSCELEFKREGDEANSITTFPNKERVMGESNKGLFNILKKDTTASTSTSLSDAVKKQVKDAKVDFIKRCAAERGTEKNKKLNTEPHSNTNTPSSTKTFTFTKASTDNNLIPNAKDQFDSWFKANYSTTIS